jgi:DNA-binding IclR family transcriptional regulator
LDSSRPPSRYRAPALEKGLDILECLAAERVPITQAQIARRLRRGSSEVFRMLACLESRGYLYKDPASGAYGLTLRLFELSHTHTPFQQIARAAEQPMQEFTAEVRESCHLSVLSSGRLVVLAQEQSPEKIRLSIEPGGTFSPLHTVSGRVLLAALNDEERERVLAGDEEYSTWPAAARRKLRYKLARIAVQGHEQAYGETLQGVYDVALPVGPVGGDSWVALAVVSLTRNPRAAKRRLFGALVRCANAIAKNAGLLGSGRR